MAGYRSLARNRDFTILWIGETISELGSTMSMFVFPLLAYSLSGSAMVTAAAEAAYLVGLVAALLPAGMAVDRTNRRTLMLATSGSGVVLYGSLAVTDAVGALTIPHLLVVALLTGIGAGVFGLRTDLSAPHRREPGRSLRQNLVEGLRFIARRPFFRALLTWAALANRCPTRSSSSPCCG